MTVAGSESNDMLNPSAILNPKIELSPQQQQQSQDHYEPQRQTVLMWGSTQHQQQQQQLQQQQQTARSHNSTPISTPPATAITIRSPNSTPATTPTNGNGQYGAEFKASIGGNRLTGNIMMTTQHSHHSSSSSKWSTGVGHAKHAYYETHPEDPSHQSYLDHQQQIHHQQSIHNNNHNNINNEGAKGQGTGSGEVWSPASTTTAYHSQYQYFTYHAPAHHHHNPSTQ